MHCDTVPPLCKKHAKCNVVLYQMHWCIDATDATDIYIIIKLKQYKNVVSMVCISA
jgi:hypothetical protein